MPWYFPISFDPADQALDLRTAKAPPLAVFQRRYHDDGVGDQKLAEVEYVQLAGHGGSAAGHLVWPARQEDFNEVQQIHHIR